MKSGDNPISLFVAAAFVVLLILLTSPPTVAQQRVPRFERSECSFEPPPTAAGLRRECGYLIVPQVRAKPNGRTLRLAVLIYRARERATAPPLLLLHGGPGGAGGMGLSWPFFQSSLTRNRDLVIYDVRGAGMSDPQLCPGWVENTAPVFNRRTRAEREQGYNEAVRACAASLKAQGIDPMAYSTAINAADIIDLRRALGYDRWDICGLSYGAALAQELMRRDPAATRAVVLLSPGTSSGPAENAFSQQRAVERVFAACAADGACHRAFPDIENDFYTVFDELAQRPLEVQTEGNKEPTIVWLDGERFLREIRHELVSSRAASLPLLINEFRRGDRAAAARRLVGAGRMEPWYPLGHLVGCNDYDANYPAAEAAAKQKLGPAFKAIADDIREHCDGWLLRLSRNKQSRLVSDIPTLIMNGEIDPHGSDLLAQKLAAGLNHAYVYTVRGRGHESLGPCAEAVVQRFLEDPTHAPDASCFANVPTLSFATRKAEAPLVLVITAAADVQTPFAGEWEAEVPVPLGRSFAIELKTDNTTVTGVIRRLPGPAEPMQIFDGKLNGNTMTFKTKSPDGLRTITFVGTLTGDEIAFRRQIEQQGAPTRPTPGFFGSAGPERFTVTRRRKEGQDR